MTSAKTFTNARVGFGGVLSGADEKPHTLFKIERGEGPALYGDYGLAYLEDGIHFNIEMRLFGYIDRYDVGDLSPSCRQHFSAEECAIVEQLIRSFFSTPGLFDQKVLRPDSFLGGIRFLPNWIIQEPHDRRQ